MCHCSFQCLLQLEEAELWYREALDLSPPEGRDTALVNLVLLMRAEGGRLQEAVDLIIRCDIFRACMWLQIHKYVY